MTNSYSLAERINSDVNASVTYKTDLQQYGKPEHWCLPTNFGDCEDYALLKRKLLLEQYLLLNKAAAGQLYKKYDLMGIVGLGIGRNWEQPSDWWCSELVAYILKNIGMKLNGWKPTHIYTPSMCYDWPKRVIDKSVF